MAVQCQLPLQSVPSLSLEVTYLVCPFPVSVVSTAYVVCWALQGGGGRAEVGVPPIGVPSICGDPDGGRGGEGLAQPPPFAQLTHLTQRGGMGQTTALQGVAPSFRVTSRFCAPDLGDSATCHRERPSWYVGTAKLFVTNITQNVHIFIHWASYLRVGGQSLLTVFF